MPEVAQFSSNREIFEVDEIGDFECCERGWYSEEEDNGSESDDLSCDEFDEGKSHFKQRFEQSIRHLLKIPKFHYKLNFIERIWGNCKATLKRWCTFRFDDFQRTQPETLVRQCTTAFLQASCKILFQVDVRLLWRPNRTISWFHNVKIHVEHDSSLHFEIRRSTRPASGVRAIVCMG